MKQVVISGYMGNIIYIPELGKATYADGEVAKKVKVTIPFISLEKYLKHTELKKVEFVEAFDYKNGTKKELSEKEINEIKSYFSKVEVVKTKDDELKEVQEQLNEAKEANSVMMAEFEEMKKQIEALKGGSSELEDLRKEYESLYGEKPNGRMKEPKLKELIELKK